MEECAIGAGSAKSVYKAVLRIFHGKTVTVAVLMMRSGSFEEEAKMILKLGRLPELVQFFGQCKDNDGDHLARCLTPLRDW